MRIALLTALLLFTTNLFAQNTDSLGIDDNAMLNRQESIFLNGELKEKLGDFNFTNKKIAFITGSSGNRLIAKSNYFNNYVKPWTDKGVKPQIFFTALKPDEKQRSGGYDALVLSWVKIFTPRQKLKTIEQLKTQAKGTQ